MKHEARSNDVIPAIGQWTLVALIVNSVVGAGIFALPSRIATLTGQWAPYAYALGALLSAVIVSIVAELASQHDAPGGAYLWARGAFGRSIAIQVGCFSWLARVTTAAAIANVLATNTRAAVDADASLYQGMIIVCATGTVAALSAKGVVPSTLTGNVVTVAKLVPLAGLIVVACVFPPHRLDTETRQMHISDVNWLEAMIVMIFAYSGFESAMIPGSEIASPRRDCARAAFIGLAVVSALYLGVHLSTMSVVPHLDSAARPLSEAATRYCGPIGAKAMNAAALLSTFGWLMAAAVTAPRLTFGMAVSGDLPAIVGKVDRATHTPIVSIALWAVAVSSIACLGSFIDNVTLSVAARLVVYSSMCASVIRLRRAYPERDAWRMPLGRVLPAIGILLCLLLSTQLRREHVVTLTTVALFGLLVSAGGRPHRSY